MGWKPMPRNTCLRLAPHFARSSSPHFPICVICAICGSPVFHSCQIRVIRGSSSFDNDQNSCARISATGV
jgi:hypothetical protein